LTKTPARQDKLQSYDIAEGETICSKPSTKRLRISGWVRASNWKIVVLLLVIAIFFHWKIIFTRQAMFPWDAGDFHYPYLAFVHEELRHLRLPLWLPYSFSGFPIIADPEGQTFYPPNWLMVLLYAFAPLPFRLVEIQIVAHFFLAGLFMFYLARDFTQDTASALFAGILFMLSGAMVGHTSHLAIINAVAWCPLVLLLARRGLLQNKLFWTIAAGFFFGIENLTGHFQHAVFLGLLLFLYFAYEACAGPLRSQLWPRWIYQLGFIAAIGAGLAMIQILPTAELSSLSIRTKVTPWESSQGNDPAYLWTLFLPNYLGGLNGVPYERALEPSFNYIFLTVPGCLLALVGLIEMARRRNFFWLGLIVVCSVISIGRAGYLAESLYYIPILNLFRHAPMYFNLANLGLCLMAAIGMRTLWNNTERRIYGRFLLITLVALLVCAVLLGFSFQLPCKIHGWFHMIAVLTLFTVIVAGMLRDRFSPHFSRFAMIGLVVFELCFYSMNQKFNASFQDDPRIALGHNYVSGRKESLQFLRSDTGNDFRVAGFAEAQWSNGWSVWRIPGIYGWNPIMLRRYQEYIREFTHYSNYAQPHGGPDHRLDSPMLDLLGVKYVVATSPIETEQKLMESSTFAKVFSDKDWWKIYRNKDYLSRTWFYPKAYLLPDPAPLLALMNARWFQPRSSLLFAKSELRGAELRQTEELHTITIGPDQVAESSIGQTITDPDCAEPRSKFAYWVGKGNWIRFDVPGPKESGRYVLLMEYAVAGHTPRLTVEVAQAHRKQVSNPVTLLRTSEWNCRTTRSTELGEFELSPGVNQLKLTLAEDAGVDLYSLWFVRLPDAEPQQAAGFSFRDFNMSPNRIVFGTQATQDGYVLLNEMDYPGWKATIDGAPAEILRADGIFRALWVPAGSHKIEFRFWPRHLLGGAAISIATLTAVLVALTALRPSKWARKRSSVLDAS
jgi:Bacterial membrane protein YfhO